MARKRLTAVRHRDRAYTYNSSLSNKTLAETEVKSHVESLLKATGASKVDILAHSMGSLNSRITAPNWQASASAPRATR
jgi:triacylglycerol esterase/lipase EstA (alpha/beta hydrolase family)